MLIDIMMMRSLTTFIHASQRWCQRGTIFSGDALRDLCHSQRVQKIYRRGLPTTYHIHGGAEASPCQILPYEAGGYWRYQPQPQVWNDR